VIDVLHGRFTYVLSALLMAGLSDEMKKRLDGVLSPMGDVSRIITVRQLADLLAYLQSLETVR
jgi:hypothetical protein